VPLYLNFFFAIYIEFYVHVGDFGRYDLRKALDGPGKGLAGGLE